LRYRGKIEPDLGKGDNAQHKENAKQWRDEVANDQADVPKRISAGVKTLSSDEFSRRELISYAHGKSLQSESG
jgi:hypothetical protein